MHSCTSRPLRHQSRATESRRSRGGRPTSWRFLGSVTRENATYTEPQAKIPSKQTRTRWQMVSACTLWLVSE
eukprot:11745289-Karenia_brevis.AAC.1